MNVDVKLDTAKINSRLKSGNSRAQKWLDNEVIKDCTPFVPRLTGELERSGVSGTKIGSGVVVWNKSYANRQYYGYFNHSVQSHPKACRTWFETAKSLNKPKWIAGAKKLGGGE